MRNVEGVPCITGCRSKNDESVTLGSRRATEIVKSQVDLLGRAARPERVTLRCIVLPLPLATPADTGAHLQERSAYPTAARKAVAVEVSLMKAGGPVAQVVDRTDKLDTADTAVKTKDTAVKTEYTAVAVDDMDVDDTAAAAGTYLQTNAHTASVFSMCHP